MHKVFDDDAARSRAMRPGDDLLLTLAGARMVFSVPSEPHTTAMPMLGVELEFKRGVHVYVKGRSTVLRQHLRRATYCHVWLSAVTGETEPALMFEDHILLLKSLVPDQPLTVLSV